MSPDTLRKARGIGLRVAFGLVVFVIAFAFSFPYDRIRQQLTAIATRRDLDVQIAEAGPMLGVGVRFDDITIDTRPTDGSKPTRFRVDTARASIAPLAWLLGSQAYGLRAETLGGEIDVDLNASKAETRLQVKGEDLAMAQLPVRESINIPILGSLGLTLDLTLPAGKAAATNGTVSWTCAACVVGDGKAKLKVAGNPMLADGLSLPRVRLGDFTGRVSFEKGVGQLQAVQARSPDGEVFIEGEIRLADPLPLSQLDLYVRFKFSEALLKSADKLQLMLQLMESMGKRPDGAYGLRMTGSFRRINPPQWLKTSPFGAGTNNPSPARNRPGRPTGTTGYPAVRQQQQQEPQQVDPRNDPGANVQRYPISPPDQTPPANIPPFDPSAPPRADAAVVGTPTGALSE